MTFGQQNTEAEAHEQLAYAKDIGINFLDTAEIYPIVPARETQGRTSEYIGTWLRHQKREDTIVATKVAGRSTGLEWVPANRLNPRDEERNPRVDKKSIVLACEAELRRLQTDYIDLLQIHWPDRYIPMFGESQYNVEKERECVPFEEQVEAMGQLIRDGKIRYYGLSNESTHGVAMHCITCDALGVPRPVSIQNQFNLLYRLFETELAEACSPSNFDLGLLPWSAMAGGALSGKYLDGAKDDKWRMNIWPWRYERFMTGGSKAAIAEYAKVAAQFNVTPAQLAYAFCKSRWFIPSTIIGATTMDQLKENMGSFNVELSPEAIAAIDDVHLRYRNISLKD